MKKSMRRCSVPGCGRKHEAKGYCAAHYNRLERGYTSPDVPLPHKRECQHPDCCNEIMGYGFCEEHGGTCYGSGQREIR